MGAVPGDPTPDDVQSKAVEGGDTENKGAEAALGNEAEVDGSTAGAEAE